MNQLNYLEVHDQQVRRVITDQAAYETDLVLVNADYPHSELDLLTEEYQTYKSDYWEKKVLAPSAMVAYLGVDYTVDKLAHHNLFLDKDWEHGFDTIFDPKKAAWPENPSYYVNVPFGQINEPPLNGHAILADSFGPGLEDTPELRERFYPRSWTIWRLNLGKTSG